MKKVLTILTLTAALVTASFAHGGAAHLMGTITAIKSDSITVTTKDNKTQVVYVTGKTRFNKSGQPAVLKDLKTGDRVVIEARQANRKLEAESVRFGKPASKTNMQDDMAKMKHGMSPTK